MIYQIQTITPIGKEVIDSTIDEEFAMQLCKDYSIALRSSCIVVREDEEDFIKE